MPEKIKVKICRGSIQETMLFQLYGRCYAMKRWPGCLVDEDSIRVIKKIDYDFSRFAKKAGPLGLEISSFSALCRQRVFESEIKEYINEHPRACVVRLGCGLDTMGRQSDNRLCNYINIDFTEVIQLRKLLLPDSERDKSIPANAKESDWFGKIDNSVSDGVVFAASGIFLYWKKSEVRTFIHKLSERFPGARLIFDAHNRRGAGNTFRMLRVVGITAPGGFYLENPEKELSSWKFKYKKISRKKIIPDCVNSDKRFSIFLKGISAYSEKKKLAQINVIDF